MLSNIKYPGPVTPQPLLLRKEQHSLCREVGGRTQPCHVCEATALLGRVPVPFLPIYLSSASPHPSAPGISRVPLYSVSPLSLLFGRPPTSFRGLQSQRSPPHLSRLPQSCYLHLSHIKYLYCRHFPWHHSE